ncbi:MAG: phosphoribosylamine--glycine ligase [Syntrophales bacterium]|nr:phosphoribosylamine--glycine ligase [Syntrophales bacterium]
MPLRILLIGNGAREHVIAETLVKSKRNPELYAFMKTNNPGIADLSSATMLGNYSDLKVIVEFAKKNKVDFAFIGPEDPLNEGVVDVLAEAGIPSIGPFKNLARLETSKSFTRNLLRKHGIPGNPHFRVFNNLEGIEAFTKTIGSFVIKPDGLTGGKGVMVQGDHFNSLEEGLKLCEFVLENHPCVIIEEKVEGEEFSLQCFCDGKTVIPTPPVQDHKRRFVGDKGPNTGGMGSYSCEDHSLPFLEKEDLTAALDITSQVANALFKEEGLYYKGIMYGGFIATKDGVKLLEYNARFGDPEAMNVLPLLKNDFVDICEAIIHGKLNEITVEFERKATVCKYIVPKGYGLPKDHPDASSTSARIEIGDTGDAKLYFASIDRKEDGLYMTTSRAIGIVGIGSNLREAEAKAEKATKSIRGPVDYRPDIGTEELINKRIKHMRDLRRKQ